MDRKDRYLIKDNGEPYRTTNGRPLLLDRFDVDPSYDPDLDARTLAGVIDELRKQGLRVPDAMLKRHNDIFLLEDNGKPYRTEDGSPIQQAWFENDVELEPGVSDMSDEEFVAKMERLGLPIPEKIRP